MQPAPLLLTLFAGLGLAACVLPGAKEPVPTGAEDFTSYCAACHGASGKGNGEMAATLDRRPSNLTRLSARNGGTFPTRRVMAKIWGYTGGRDGSTVMPNFGPLLDSETVPYDSGDGIQTPTPIRLVQLADYLRSIQGK